MSTSDTQRHPRRMLSSGFTLAVTIGGIIGWVDWLSFVGDIALRAFVVTEFAALLIPAAAQWQAPLAIIVSSVFAALQFRGIALGAKIQAIAVSILALLTQTLRLQ